MRGRRVLYVQYTNPGAYPPLLHGARLFADAGWKVVSLGIRVRRTESLEGGDQAGIHTFRLPYCGPGILQRIHYALFWVSCVATVAVFRPRWIYASDQLSCPVVLSLSLIPGLRVLYHEHDVPSLGVVDWAGRVLSAARAGLCRRAHLVVTPNLARQSALPPVPASRRLVVANYPLLRQVATSGRDVWSPPLRLILQGSLGPARLPLSLFSALGELPSDVQLTIAGYVAPDGDDHIAACRREVLRLGLTSRVRFEGVLPRGELIQAMREHDVGLLLLDPSTRDVNLLTLVGASNKVYEYLAAGLPVIVPNTPDWEDALVSRGVAVACDTAQPSSIASAIRSFRDSPTTMREMGERGRRLVQEVWNYDACFRPVLTLMAASLKGDESAAWASHAKR